MTAARTEASATIEAWLAVPEERQVELIEGRTVELGVPGLVHGMVLRRLGTALDGFDRERRSEDELGGWWISQRVDLAIGGIVCRPDLVGWERALHPHAPKADKQGVITVAPTWICEVLSKRTASVDMGAKRAAYHRAGVSWFWLVAPHHRTLTVLRRTEPDYLVVRIAGAGERVAAEPFEGVEVDLARVFEMDEDEGSAGEQA